MIPPDALERIEAIVDASGVTDRIEALLPVGVRPRQLGVRTLLVGIGLTLWKRAPAHLSRVHETLIELDDGDRVRLGVVVIWRRGPHRLTYRQVERTFGLCQRALCNPVNDGEPSDVLHQVVTDLVEASVPERFKKASASLAVDWTDIESFSSRHPKRPRSEPDGWDIGAEVAGAEATSATATEETVELPAAGHDGSGPGGSNSEGDVHDDAEDDAERAGASRYQDPDATWGHRRGGGPGERHPLFLGYYLQFATMVEDESGPGVPELIRRVLLTACRVDPPRAFAPVLAAMAQAGIVPGDVLCDCGYSHRVPEHWAQVLRAAGFNLVMDLHPGDRGPQGTFKGAICHHGNLYCPKTPAPLLALGPLAAGASSEDKAAHDATAAELSHYKLGTVAGYDQDGYRRVSCPAHLDKVRCPLVERSLAAAYDRPEIHHPPEDPPPCCTQRTITVPPEVNAKTVQKHDYPSKDHRLSYARRSGAERANATVKDPATNDIARGWCRVMGLSAMTVMVALVVVARNQRIIDSFEARQALAARRSANGLPVPTRRRRRRTTTDLIGSGASP